MISIVTGAFFVVVVVVVVVVFAFISFVVLLFVSAGRTLGTKMATFSHRYPSTYTLH